MLRSALEDVGAARSIVIDEADTVLAGNGVLQAAATAGIARVRIIPAEGDELIAVRRSNLTAEQKQRLALYDNRTAELAEWNVDQLRQAEALDLKPFFTDAELRGLFGATTPKDGNTDPDAVPPVRATTIRRGDLFELGAHRLLCGDATSASDLERVLSGTTAAVCLTDPPYGIGLKYDGYDDTRAALVDLAGKWLPLARQAARAVVFSSGIKNMWLYPQPDWILCWFYNAGQFRVPWGYNCWQPFLAYGKDPSLAGGLGSRPDSVDSNQPANAADISHPCPKPMAVWEWMINRLTFAAQAVILDVFAGSGTGVLAAERLQRRGVAIELSPAYCQVIIDRWEQFTGQKATKVGDDVRGSGAKSTRQRSKGRKAAARGRGR